ncbi:MAG: SpoIIE family protein phosphatase [Lachnospiraceae bacterium]|nr:SpoIIE family protein phosphatase [Lachnospiraceae bacterium]
MKKKIMKVMLVISALLLIVLGLINMQLLYNMRNILLKNSEATGKEVEEYSDSAMRDQITERLSATTLGCAFTANETLSNFGGTVQLLADTTTDVYNNPARYGKAKVVIPQKSDIGKNMGQFLYAEDVDPNNSEILDELSMIGNLQGNLVAMYSQYPELGANYIGTETGIMLLGGDVLKDRWDENGNYVNLDPRKRPWYAGARETGKLYFTGISEDYDTGELAIMCGAPVYKKDEFVGVAGAGLYLDGIKTLMLNARIGDEGDSCIVDSEGVIIFSSKDDGELKVQSNLISQEGNNKELSALAGKAAKGESGLELLSVDGENYYVAYSPIEVVNWSLISIIPEKNVIEPTERLLASLKDTRESELKEVNNIIRSSVITIMALLVIMAVLTAIMSNKLSHHLVKPIELLTSKVSSLEGDQLDFEWGINTNDEVQSLALSFESMTERMKKYIIDIQNVTAEKERIGAELNVATQIQADMLPSIFPPFPERTEFDIFAYMRPAKEVGGDLYDFFMIDDDHLAVTVADVSGKGVPAALFMVITKTHLKNRTQQDSSSPAAILHDVNNLLCEGNEAGMFVTVWLGILTISTGHVIAANAGHEYPAILDGDGKFTLMKDKHGFVLAGMEDSRFKDYEFDLEKGGGFFIYSDGVPEATNKANVLYGTDRMLEALNAGENTKPEVFLNRVEKDVDKFYDGAPQFDDLTMVGVVWRG